VNCNLRYSRPPGRGKRVQFFELVLKKRDSWVPNKVGKVAPEDSSTRRNTFDIVTSVSGSNSSFLNQTADYFRGEPRSNYSHEPLSTQSGEYRPLELSVHSVENYINFTPNESESPSSNGTTLLPFGRGRLLISELSEHGTHLTDYNPSYRNMATSLCSDRGKGPARSFCSATPSLSSIADRVRVSWTPRPTTQRRSSRPAAQSRSCSTTRAMTSGYCETLRAKASTAVCLTPVAKIPLSESNFTYKLATEASVSGIAVNF